MISKEIKITGSSPGRRKFVWRAGILSLMAIVASVFKIPFSRKKSPATDAFENKRKMVRMLSEDGRLVEIDEALLISTRKKISDTELQNWIKK